jgi:alkylation response protein AidB-like acyl-CoA dehydrogenase
LEPIDLYFKEPASCNLLFLKKGNSHIFLSCINQNINFLISENLNKNRSILQLEQNRTSNQLDTFEEFIRNYREVLAKVFREPQNHKTVSLQRGVPPMLMRDVMQCRPLRVFIPEEHGGFGGDVSQCLAMLEASSYESLPLSLMMGINGALFIQPVTRYASHSIAPEILSVCTNESAMGGLMITEPGFGSDALHMQTSYPGGGQWVQSGRDKHWAGLTGWADYWLLTARKRKKDGRPGERY